MKGYCKMDSFAIALFIKDYSLSAFWHAGEPKADSRAGNAYSMETVSLSPLAMGYLFPFSRSVPPSSWERTVT